MSQVWLRRAEPNGAEPTLGRRLTKGLLVLLPAIVLAGGLWLAPKAYDRSEPPAAGLVQPAVPETSTSAPSTSSVPAPSTTAVAAVDGPGGADGAGEAPQAPQGAVSLPLPGCPPPPRPPTPPGPPPGAWKPPVLVAEADLPEPIAPEEARPPALATPDLGPISGKGMWIWKFRQSQGGDAQAIVDRARATGLSQLWVRVGDSRDGFYGAEVLGDLVPRAHSAGLSVIGWGFPYLHDPVADAGWGAEALAWRGPTGAGLDGFSPDMERSSEGVVMTERRAQVYLGLLRRAAGSGLLVATVYRPTDRLWSSDYPYTAIASYVDALAPMVYWGCTEPGAAAAQALERLRTLAPVHMIGQGYDMATEGGRVGAPSGRETSRFLEVSAAGDAVGASFWVWQFMESEQWQALTGFRWRSGGGRASG